VIYYHHTQKGESHMAVQHDHWISPEEYLEIDRASLDIKYEYEDGQMYAMSGGTIEHARIAQNMLAALDAHFGEGPCRVFSSDVRVQVTEKKYYYPDVTVSCNPEDRQRGIDIIRSPRLVMEVLSPSTETRDRRGKLLSYQACPSIQECILVSTQLQWVEVFRRHTESNIWVYHQFGPAQEVELTSINFTIPIATLYRLTDIPEL
jgi:Uma2 family endonuclease